MMSNLSHIPLGPYQSCLLIQPSYCNLMKIHFECNYEEKDKNLQSLISRTRLVWKESLVK